MQIRIVRLNCCGVISYRKEGITPADTVNQPTLTKNLAKKNAKNYKKNANYYCRFTLRCSSSSSTKKKIVVIQSAAVGVFALGFIDAGYSGDWSRIGVISRGTEDLLKTSAFLVVPFCLLLILISLSRLKVDDDIED